MLGGVERVGDELGIVGSLSALEGEDLAAKVGGESALNGSISTDTGLRGLKELDSATEADVNKRRIVGSLSALEGENLVAKIGGSTDLNATFTTFNRTIIGALNESDDELGIVGSLSALEGEDLAAKLGGDSALNDRISADTVIGVLNELDT